MPVKSLPSRPSLEHLKNQARDLLQAFAKASPQALSRVREFHPKFAHLTATQRTKIRFVLADAQLVVAREYGFDSWPKLKAAVIPKEPGPSSAPRAIEDLETLVARFLEYAAPDHHIRGGPAHLIARDAALLLLKRYPEIATHNLATAVVCGEIEEVKRILSRTPNAAREQFVAAGQDRSGVGTSEDVFRDNGAKRWEPLLFLCYTRLPLKKVADHAVEIATLLLDHGANPNAWFQAGDCRFTTLVGVIGEGEENRPAHPQRDALTRLLLERGTDPFDIQVVYNVHFRGEILWIMKLMHEFSARSGRKSAWDDPEWSMLGMGNYGSGARWHLEIAIKKNNPELAAWLLEHGANPNAAPATDPRFSKRSLYEHALLQGCPEIAELLVRHGAVRTNPAFAGPHALLSACLRLDREEAARLLKEHPQFREHPRGLFHAAEFNRVELLELLFELGFSPALADHTGQTALHVAAFHGSAAVAKRLIEQGARIDPVDRVHQSAPIWWAIWGQQNATIDILAERSQDLAALTFLGKIDRVRELLQDDPLRAPVGNTALHWLPGDEGTALQMVELLLAHGANPKLKNREGLTPAELAEKRGLQAIAERLRTTT